MFIIWLTALIYLILGYLIQYHMTDTFHLTFSFIIITAVLLFLWLFIRYTKFFIIVYTGFLLRLTMLWIDLSDGGWTIPHSGEDTENFYETGVMISDNLTLLNEAVYGGIYSKVLGVIFHIYGDDRLFVQFLNILVTISAILIVIRIFRMLDVPGHIQMVLVVTMSFFPHSMIFSSILLRESVISLMVVLSLYFFIRWFVKEEKGSALLSIIFILLGAVFHSAIIGILIGYLFGFIFYRHRRRTFRFTVDSVVPFSLFALVMTYILVFPDVVTSLPIFNKFEQILNSNDEVYEAFTATRGDTAYLSGLEINNLFQLILYSPIKIVYFIASPMPWSIRNFNDLISFFMDGVFYLSALILFIKNLRLIKKRPLLGILILSIFAGWLIFSLGISNAGTALRHRFKFFYIIIVAMGILLPKKKR
ncbi:hypothetical protein [Salinicoccus albus]|uniref:hypothetical protein n=1 Tax=Salinicoccus albus TaxID=418756 RepID=UPI0003675907|nr:hypothetical protein [Salinicoccus albus]